MKRGYYYSSDGHNYWLVPIYNQGKRRIWLTAAEMYNDDGELVGTWMRHNMPYPLIVSLTTYIKEYVLRQVKLQPKAYSVTYPKSKRR